MGRRSEEEGGVIMVLEEGDGALECAPASLLRKDVRRSCLSLILFLCGGGGSSVLDSRGVLASAVRCLGVFLVIVMISPCACNSSYGGV